MVLHAVTEEQVQIETEVYPDQKEENAIISNLGKNKYEITHSGKGIW